MLAASSGSSELVAMFLEAKANVNAQDKVGVHLHICVQNAIVYVKSRKYYSKIIIAFLNYFEFYYDCNWLLSRLPLLTVEIIFLGWFNCSHVCL